MKKIASILLTSLCLAGVCILEPAASASAKGGEQLLEVKDMFNLDYPGMEAVRDAVREGSHSEQMTALLDYFKHRDRACPSLDLSNITISESEQKWADDALEHRFFVHQGYQPSYFYGDDIDWTYWPVKDNELRWQLHRHKWFVPLGKAWRVSGDEKYVNEWMAEYRDWIEKNPLQADENARYAWRPLEISHRIDDQIRQFLLCINADGFNEDFLELFLWNYHRSADYMRQHYSKQGNHLLFEAKRILAAALFFPEFKDAAIWRDEAIDILNREILTQVYEDGVHFELDPHYHLESIILFYNALDLCDYYGELSRFPESYVQTVHKMIEVTYNQMYPDFTMPLFSDCRYIPKSHIQENCELWAKVYSTDDYISYLASDGEEGRVPSYRSKAFPKGGFYILRTGWDQNATVVDFKAGPPAFWHCQPDNGTFEYWHKGRNFFPDSGSYIYSGDKSILEQREWFRQTRVHNTVTLDDRNLDTTDSKLLNWSACRRKVTVANNSYPGFTHTRTMKLRRNGTLIIRDVVTGEASGEVGVHFNLAPGEIAIDDNNRVSTLFADGNNISIVTTSRAELNLRRDEGWTSPSYKVRTERPAYTVTADKNYNERLVFVTKIRPVK